MVQKRLTDEQNRYYVDTAGKNTKAIKDYISNQLKHDQENDQLSLFDPRDPFMGSKKTLHGWQANLRTHLCVASIG